MKEVIERCNWLVNKCEDKAITPDVKDDVRYLLEEIERLNKENKELQDRFNSLMEAHKICDEENNRLNNIINELEEWCLSWKENDKYCYLASNDKDKCRYDIWEEVLDKLQELKNYNIGLN